MTSGILEPYIVQLWEEANLKGDPRVVARDWEARYSAPGRLIEANELESVALSAGIYESAGFSTGDIYLGLDIKNMLRTLQKTDRYIIRTIAGENSLTLLWRTLPRKSAYLNLVNFYNYFSQGFFFRKRLTLAEQAIR